MRSIVHSVSALLAAAAFLISMPRTIEAQRFATDDPVLQGIWDQAMDNSQLETLAQSLLDSIGPRLTASPGMEAAQDWAIEMMQSWGVEARTEQYGTWEGWERGPSHVDLIAPRVRSLEGRILAWSPGTGGRPARVSRLNMKHPYHPCRGPVRRGLVSDTDTSAVARITYEASGSKSA